ncbi:hypothetical protein [Galbibacter sp. BG1]
MAVFSGPTIVAASASVAQNWCYENGLGYCEVVGEFKAIPIRESLELKESQLN